jgi:hypothetical protein
MDALFRGRVLSRGASINELGSPSGQQDLLVVKPRREQKWSESLSL